MVIVWIVGVLIGLLLAAPMYRQSRASAELGPSAGLPRAVALPVAETGSHALLEALPRLCENRGTAARDEFGSSEERRVIIWRQAQTGIRNARRLLPLAKRLTLEAIKEAGSANGVRASGLAAAKRRIEAVSRVVLDSQLGSAGEVWDDRPSEIRIGPEYAMHLTSDDDAALLLLGHELTHVAAWSGQLDGFFESLSNKARLADDIEPTIEQKEDLACDFVATLVVKRFVERKPTDESKAARLSRAIGYESPSERLQYAWEDFCASYRGDSGDDEHLGKVQMLHALLALDPELKALVLAEPVPPPS